MILRHYKTKQLNYIYDIPVYICCTYCFTPCNDMYHKTSNKRQVPVLRKCWVSNKC